MNILEANAILALQDKEIRKLNKKRFYDWQLEYEMRYEGGFAPMIALWRRIKGTRKFYYWDSVDVHKCRTAGEALAEIKKKVGIS